MEAKVLLNDIVELTARIRVIKECFNLYTYIIINTYSEQFEKELNALAHMMERYIKETYDLSARINHQVEFGN